MHTRTHAHTFVQRAFQVREGGRHGEGHGGAAATQSQRKHVRRAPSGLCTGGAVRGTAAQARGAGAGGGQRRVRQDGAGTVRERDANLLGGVCHALHARARHARTDRRTVARCMRTFVQAASAWSAPSAARPADCSDSSYRQRAASTRTGAEPSCERGSVRQTERPAGAHRRTAVPRRAVLKKSACAEAPLAPSPPSMAAMASNILQRTLTCAPPAMVSSAPRRCGAARGNALARSGTACTAALTPPAGTIPGARRAPQRRHQSRVLRSWQVHTA